MEVYCFRILILEQRWKTAKQKEDITEQGLFIDFELLDKTARKTVGREATGKRIVGSARRQNPIVFLWCINEYFSRVTLNACTI